MKLNIKLLDLVIRNELNFYWTSADFKDLLQEFGFLDVASVNESELKDLLLMAITDAEPAEAATILLKYKLGKQLRDGQIQDMSHDMQNDKLAEEYPDPALHFDLFNINQLLFKAFNGTFPNTEAVIIKMSITGQTKELTKEILVKALSQGLKENHLVHRLYENQLNGEEAFTDAGKVIWHIREMTYDEYEVITSRYWIEKEDFAKTDYEANLVFHEGEED